MVFTIIWRRMQPTVDSAIHNQLGLRCVRQLAEKVRGNKPVNSVLLWSQPLFCFKLGPWVPDLASLDKDCFGSWCVSQQRKAN